MADNIPKPTRVPPTAPARTAPARPAPAAAPVAPAATPSGRIVSLDALRGFDMFWIIGGRELVLGALLFLHKPIPEWATRIQQQLDHSRWEGFTFYDLIMPLFLFVVGAVMPFSFSRRSEIGHSKLRLFFKILTRAFILFIIGMAVQGRLLEFELNVLHPFSNTLQAIAVGYLVAGILMLIVPIWTQVVVAILLLVGYWALLMYVPVPGHGSGILEEKANIAYSVEQWTFGKYIDGTDPPYTWILSSMTFSATVLLGVFAGYTLRSRYSPFMKFVWLTLLGLVCLGAGWAWAEYLHFPIIKHIWTSSMALWAAGWSFLLLAAFYLVIDVVRFRFWAFPLVVIGMNAIVAYVVYRFVPFRSIAAGLVGGLAKHLGTGEEFTIALTTVLLVWLLLYYLYRHKTFVRI
jgi:predicted acyltransferase